MKTAGPALEDNGQTDRQLPGLALAREQPTEQAKSALSAAMARRQLGDR